ncbi:MAG: hypothetical protein DCC68_09805 [Planctomycetota bacterium]|nr:MAG: hypothetical protein DCC68_09805 [Planctomycetota bacterium]
MSRTSRHKRRLAVETLEDRSLLSLTATLVGVFPVESGSCCSVIGTAGDKLLFRIGAAPEVELWSTDGSPGGTQLLRSGFQSLTNQYPPTPAYRPSDILYFSAYDGDSGTELWRSDGTPQGTYLVADISPGPDASSPRSFEMFNGALHFVATHPTLGPRIFQSDGTEAGTSPIVSDTDWPGLEPSQLTAAGDKLFYVDRTVADGSELWVTDGTAAGSRLVRAIGNATGPSAGSERPERLVSVSGTLYFQYVVHDPIYGRRGSYWTSDGTAEGTVVIPDTYPAQESDPFFTGLGDSVLFVLDPYLYRYDGQELEIIADAYGQESQNKVQAAMLAKIRDEIYFRDFGEELWVTDGTQKGTRLVKRVTTISDGDYVGDPQFVTVGDRLFFTAHHGIEGWVLWTSDGTTDGTQKVLDFFPDDLDYFTAQFELIPAGNRLYFFAGDPYGYGPRELWKIEPETQFADADVNEDGSVDLGDVAAMIRAPRFLQGAPDRRDADRDGEVTIRDILFVRDSFDLTTDGLTGDMAGTAVQRPRVAPHVASAQIAAAVDTVVDQRRESLTLTATSRRKHFEAETKVNRPNAEVLEVLSDSMRHSARQSRQVRRN